MDEMEKMNKLKNIENSEREIKSITKQKEELLVKAELFKKKIKLLDENYKIVVDNFVYLNPSWKYEQVPDYINNLLEINKISQDENRLVWKANLEGIENGLKTLDEQIESQVKLKEKMEKELKEDE